jgi:hypothetical protein
VQTGGALLKVGDLAVWPPDPVHHVSTYPERST